MGVTPAREAGVGGMNTVERNRGYNREYQAMMRREHPEHLKEIAARHAAKALAELMDPTDPRHGKEGTYVIGCRCAECREAHRIRTRDYRARRKAAA